MLEAVARFLNVLAAVLAVRGQGDVAEIARYVSTALRTGSNVDSRLDELVEVLQRMVAEDRDPTPEEMQLLRDRRAELSAQIRSYKPEVLS